MIIPRSSVLSRAVSFFCSMRTHTHREKKSNDDFFTNSSKLSFSSLPRLLGVPDEDDYRDWMMKDAVDEFLVEFLQTPAAVAASSKNLAKVFSRGFEDSTGLVDLLYKLLTWSSTKRIKSIDALKHYFWDCDTLPSEKICLHLAQSDSHHVDRNGSGDGGLKTESSMSDGEPDEDYSQSAHSDTAAAAASALNAGIIKAKILKRKWQKQRQTSPSPSDDVS
jgi:hypothetical protein